MRGAVVHPDQPAEQLAGGGAGQRGRHRLCGRPHAAVGVGKHVGHFLRAGGNPQAKAVIAEEWLAGGQLPVVRVRVRMGDGAERIDIGIGHGGTVDGSAESLQRTQRPGAGGQSHHAAAAQAEGSW
ncbi:hypothetical protein D3C72_1839340 [compost metagenome]